MKNLQILNAVLTAAAASLGLVLGVVGVIYSFYIADVPRLQDEFWKLVLISLAFWLVAGAAALAFIGQKRRSRWRWSAQCLPVIPMALVVAFFLYVF